MLPWAIWDRVLSMSCMYFFSSRLVSWMEAISMPMSNESERVSSGAQTLSEGAVRQASTVEELSAGIQDISGEISMPISEVSGSQGNSVERLP